MALEKQSVEMLVKVFHEAYQKASEEALEEKFRRLRSFEGRTQPAFQRWVLNLFTKHRSQTFTKHRDEIFALLSGEDWEEVAAIASLAYTSRP